MSLVTRTYFQGPHSYRNTGYKSIQMSDLKTFVLAYVKSMISHDMAHIIHVAVSDIDMYIIAC